MQYWLKFDPHYFFKQSWHFLFIMFVKLPRKIYKAWFRYCNYISVFNYFVQHETTSYEMFYYKVILRLFKGCMLTTTHLKVSLTGKEHSVLNKQRRNAGKYLYLKLNRKSSLSELCNHCFDRWSLLLHITFRHLDFGTLFTRFFYFYYL
jgi:hypothetical protein